MFRYYGERLALLRPSLARVFLIVLSFERFSLRWLLLVVACCLWWRLLVVAVAYGAAVYDVAVACGD